MALNVFSSKQAKKHPTRAARHQLGRLLIRIFKPHGNHPIITSPLEQDSNYERLRYQQQKKKVKMPLPALSVSPAASPRSSSLLSPATPLPAETDTLIPNITLRRPSFPVSQSMDSLCMSSKPVIRHAHTGSDLSMVSNLTTHSEDLTAKEFADMAGITILPEDDDDAFLDDAILNDSLADLVEDLDLGSILHEKQSIASSSLISRHCSMRSNKSLPRLQIWDSGFWQTNPSSPHVPPILHELRRIQSTNLQPHPRLQLRRNKSCVIKKGRFLVSLETADLADPNAVSLT